jgi:hypothetical protein
MSTYYFSCSGGPGAVLITCVFASSGIGGSGSAFWCVRTVKHRRSIFVLGWDLYRFHKKHAGRPCAKLVFLYPVGSAGHVLHSAASKPCNIDALFFMLGWARCGFDKKRVGRCYTELVFLHYVAHVVHSGVSGSQNIDKLFFMLGWDP